MPYSTAHKQKARERITEAARILFNRHGFEAVSIDMVMEEVDLTRGGFYNHFDSKESLYTSAVQSFFAGARRSVAQRSQCPRRRRRSWKRRHQR